LLKFSREVIKMGVTVRMSDPDKNGIIQKGIELHGRLSQVFS